jgi:hypothetical protein
MANFIGLDKGYIPDGSSAAAANRFCVIGTDDQHIDLTPSAGEMVLGVVMDNVDADKVVGGTVVNVRLEGIAPVIAFDAITLGAEVSTTTAGLATVADTQGWRVAGIALQAASANDIINVLLTPAGRIIP